MYVTHRKTCRVCGSRALTPVINLGEQSVQGVFIKAGEPEPPKRKVPMELVLCDPSEDEKACGLLQTKYTVPPPILYERYWYVSGTNKTMTDHLQAIPVALLNWIRTGASILDIGCNDGTLLSAFPSTMRRVGVDPSNIIDSCPPDIETYKAMYPAPVLEGEQFDIITSIAMFYDLEDPVAFAFSVRKNLRPNGVWVFEQSYMPEMLRLNSYDTVCHEHLEYYSFAVIERILAKAGLKVFDLEFNAINGGSIRCYATHAGNTSVTIQPVVQSTRRSEFDGALDTTYPYTDFQTHIEKMKHDLVEALHSIHRVGKTVHIYGASTKGNTILQFCGINTPLVTCAADRNPDKWGATTLNGIPIVSEEKSRASKPDYYLVLPWHFRKEFLDREADALIAGTKFIFPLPRLEIVGATLPAMKAAV